MLTSNFDVMRQGNGVRTLPRRKNLHATCVLQAAFHVLSRQKIISTKTTHLDKSQTIHLEPTSEQPWTTVKEDRFSVFIPGERLVNR
jgi:hypothetical protein